MITFERAVAVQIWGGVVQRPLWMSMVLERCNSEARVVPDKMYHEPDALRDTSCGPDSSDTTDSAGESIMTEVNIAEDCVMDVGADDVVVFELCADRAGVGRYILLSRLKGLLVSAVGGSFGEAAQTGCQSMSSRGPIVITFD